MGSPKRHEWFRNRSWTPEIEAEFERRLTRARTPHNRGQYLFIQVYCLWKEARATPEGAPELLRAAVALFNRMVRDYPDNIHVLSAYTTKGQCAEVLGDARGALEQYRHAVERMRRRPNMRNDCWIDFAFLAARQGSPVDHEEALALLDEFADETLPFPIQRFKKHASAALIASARGQAAEARAEAQLALAAAERLTSDFAHHSAASEIGIVGHCHVDLRHRLATLVRGAH